MSGTAFAPTGINAALDALLQQRDIQVQRSDADYLAKGAAERRRSAA